MKGSFTCFITILLFVDICFTNAWIPSSLYSSTAKDLATRIGCRRRLRFPREFAPAFRRRQKRRRCNIERTNRDSTYSSLHDKSNGVDMEEEDFYREYENKYSSNGEDNDYIEKESYHFSNTEKVQIPPEKLQKQKNTVQFLSNLSPNNTKVEPTKTWNKASMQSIVGALDTIENDTEESRTISNLSDLQRQVQRIQKRNKNPPSQDETVEIDETSNVLSSESKIGAIGEDLKRNDQYLLILRKAQERLSEINSNSLSKLDGSGEINVSNVSILQERLNQIQLDVSAMEKSDMDDSPSSEPSQASKQPLKAKYLDDETLAEWETLDKQLQKEKILSKNRYAPSSIVKEVDMEITAVDETDIVDTLRSKATSDTIDSKRDVENLGSNRINNIFDEDDNGALEIIPPHRKEFVSEYEITNDGGVFLSPEAYREAGNKVNPDGSLNFGRGENVKASNSKGKQQKVSAVDGAFVENKPPVAKDVDGKRSDSAVSQKDVSIEDLIIEANHCLEYARNHPEAQEELHRRIMAEFEAEESTDDEFENQALLDPEKVIEFWNREHFEKQKDEVDALEELLDQKMGMLTEVEEAGVNETIGKDGRPRRKIDLQKGDNEDLKNIFFASRDERIEREKAIENNRREYAKHIANYYKDVEENTGWYSSSKSEDGEETITPDFLPSDSVIDIENDELSIEKLYPTKSPD